MALRLWVAPTPRLKRAGGHGLRSPAFFYFTRSYSLLSPKTKLIVFSSLLDQILSETVWLGLYF